ncbi:MAG: hypothetical protein DWQ10_13975 [Calditrichaeota bacterium]|nr:MAG: hypothetical protein DWQ10_13975 [Calditrichota bacterium]
MYKNWIIFVLFFSILPGCTKNETASDKLVESLPDIEGWQLVEQPKTYTEDNLFDYINGNCELYFPYGFVRLLSATYENPTNSDETLVVDIYDMGTPLGAYGVYSSMMHPDYAYSDVGCESIHSDQQVRFWQDQYQIEINCPQPFSNTQNLMKIVASSLSKNLPGCKVPKELSWLPEQNQEAHTLKYIADGFLGMSNMPGGFEADYVIDGSQGKGFVVKCNDKTEAQQLLTSYKESQKAFKDVDLQDKDTHFSSFHKYSGHVWAGVKGVWFYGALSKENPEICSDLANAIAGNLVAEN